MKKAKSLLVAMCTLASVVVSAANAATIRLEPASKLEIDIPDSWKSEIARENLDSGIAYRVELSAPEEQRISVKIRVGHFAKSRAPSPEQARQKLQRNGERELGQAVEKQVVIKDLEVKNGFGFFYTITDASLVGKPPKPDDYKTITRLMIYYGDNDSSAIVAILADDANGPAFQQTLKVLAGMKPSLVVPQTAGEEQTSDSPPRTKIELKKSGKGMVIGRSGSRTQLLIPSADFAEQRGAGNRGRPGYFMGGDDRIGIIVSGWFEPAAKFGDGTARKMWESEGITKAPNVEVTKIGDWDVIAYEMPSIPRLCSSELRANLVTADTWIDLHMSLHNESCSEARKQLLAYLKAMLVTVAPE